MKNKKFFWYEIFMGLIIIIGFWFLGYEVVRNIMSLYIIR